MFGRGHQSTPAPVNANASVMTIPEVFYGGNDPEAVQTSTSSGKVLTPKISAPSSDVVSPVRTKLIAAVMIFIFVSACAAAGWYYWNYLRLDTPAKTVTTEKKPAEVAIVTPTTTTEIITPTSTDETTPSSTTSNLPSLSELALEFSTINQIDTTDFDADGLTDAEEEVFGTDPSVFDTDKDEYYDGQEVGNLYNPKGLAPVRIIDSGLVREYVAPADAYRLYYPVPWTVGTIDPAGNTILITAANGDYIEVRQYPKNSGEDFGTWFGRAATSERITDLESGVNRFKISYLRRKDDLSAYVDMPNSVLVLIYHPATNSPINFRHIFRMMLESLRVKGVGITDTAPAVTTSST